MANNKENLPPDDESPDSGAFDKTVSDPGKTNRQAVNPDSYAPTVQHEIQDAGETVLSEPETDIVEGYRVISKLGEGGMGVVYKATQRSLSRDVALKLMKDMGDDESFVARFRREAITGARLNHPNIVGVYDHGHIQGNVYLVLEFVKGKNCAELIDESGRMAVPTVLEIIRGCILGLSHAEKLGVIHRDIKPANIMVVDDDASDARGTRRLHAKIADFGLARIHDRSDPEHVELTQTGSVMGTPGYMAPEQALGREVDFRGDIYSLGSTMYCLLTGTKPFHGATMVEILHKKLNETAPNPQSLVGDIANEVIVVLDRMMAKSADDRYQSYENLLLDIEALIAGEAPQTQTLDQMASSLDVGGRTTRNKFAKRPKGAPAVGNKAVLFLGILVVIAVAAFGVMTMSSDDGGGDARITGDLIQQIDSFGAMPVASFVDGFEQHCQTFEAGLAKVEDGAEQDRLRGRFRAVLSEQLRKNEGARLTQCEEKWQSRSWTELAALTRKMRERYAKAGRILPPRCTVLDGFAESALDGRSAQMEEQAFKRLSAAVAQPSPDTLKELESFSSRFPFSPALSWMNDKEQEVRSALTGAAPTDDAAKALLSRLFELEGETFFDAWETARDEWKKALSPLPIGTRAGLDNQKKQLLKAKAQGYSDWVSMELERRWKARNYVDLRTLPGVAEARLKEAGVDIPSGWAAYATYGELSKRGAAVEESAAWTDLNETRDLVARITMAQDYLQKYGAFSPSVDAVRAMIVADTARAPLFTLEVVPESAKVALDGKSLPKPRWKAHRLAGTHKVTASAAGYYDYKGTIEHSSENGVHKVRLAKQTTKSLKIDLSDPNNVNPLRRFLNPAYSVELQGKGTQIANRMSFIEISSNDMEVDAWKSAKPIQFFQGRRALKLFPAGKEHFWQFHASLALDQGGSCELGLLEGEDGRQVVVGLQQAAAGTVLYFGTRSGGTVDVMHRMPLPNAKKDVRISLTWYGDVCTLGICPTVKDSAKNAPVVSSVEVDWQRKSPAFFTVSVNRAKCRFGEIEIFPLK